ncbi:Retrovirus-related Pol polyprotein from transposon TNT 1-94 [Vitis vinifera]|uniref:Retrovirus-related Pol polyprotein from transposon TNT 1-94 n=1 Tax=Vitis vinifera TaxID=29760 RepID=A0A438G553_VITVI|nr:Retrovirus-related Pol polyprotein from transposon TNT 1-94 [Vitis vinifera]
MNLLISLLLENRIIRRELKRLESPTSTVIRKARISRSVEMRRSQRTRRPALSNDYYVYLGEGEYGIGEEVDLTTYREALSSDKANEWLIAMRDEMQSMSNNDREGIDFTRTFSPVSTKESFRLIMALVAHFDLVLHQMDVKTTFLNGNLSGEVYMSQLEGFKENGKWNMNKFDQCVYMKVNGSKYIFMVLYIDDILLASSDVNLLNDTKRITCKAGNVPVVKGDKLSNEQCPKNDLEKNSMKTIPYASAIGSLMYAQVCTRPDIAFIVNVLGRYFSNLRRDHWVAAKKVKRYLQ